MAKSGTSLDPDALRVFAAVARAGGVRGAARVLGTPRSTVSRKLAELEASVGRQLVVRTSRRFDLTELGTELARRGDELDALLRASEELVRSGSSEPSGVLHVAVAPVLGEEILPAVLAELLARHPRLTIDARLSVDYVDLRRGAVDVALRAGTLDDATDLFAVRLGTSVRGCYASPRYLATHGTPASPAELEKHECILVGPQPRVVWTFRSGARELRVAVSGRLRVDSYRVARDAAALGAGIVLVTKVFADPLVARGDLVPILERNWPRVVVHAVHAGPTPASPKVAAFIEAARAASRVSLADDAPPRWRSS